MLGEFGSYIIWSYVLFFGSIGALCVWLIVQNRSARKRLAQLQKRDDLAKR
ncbi:MAG: heme exporter protein CcmD [Pseudomonadota bacterium]